MGISKLSVIFQSHLRIMAEVRQKTEATLLVKRKKNLKTQGFVIVTFQQTLSAGLLCNEVEQYAKYSAVGTAIQQSGSYFSEHYIGTEKYSAARYAGTTVRTLVLCQPRNLSEPSWKCIWHLNASSRELAERFLLDSHLSHKRRVAIAHKMFSNDFQALACFNTSRNLRMYGGSDSHLTNGTLAIDELRNTDMEISCQLRHYHNSTRRFHASIAVSWRDLLTVTNRRLHMTVILKKQRSPSSKRNQNI